MITIFKTVLLFWIILFLHAILQEALVSGSIKEPDDDESLFIIASWIGVDGVTVLLAAMIGAFYDTEDWVDFQTDTNLKKLFWVFKLQMQLLFLSVFLMHL